jgi:ADP-ribose pyrophosphatase YjhB (NUDIX family)
MLPPSIFTFCPHCAEALQAFVSDGIPRRRCPACGWIQYRNPTVGVAVALIEEGKLLIGRRRTGGWCIPCGHTEYDELVEEAAVREMAEETGLRVSLDGLLAVKSNFHDPERQTVGIWYRGRRVSGSLRPGGDLAEVEFTELARMRALLFPTDQEVADELRVEMGLVGERGQ